MRPYRSPVNRLAILPEYAYVITFKHYHSCVCHNHSRFMFCHASSNLLQALSCAVALSLPLSVPPSSCSQAYCELTGSRLLSSSLPTPIPGIHQPDRYGELLQPLRYDRTLALLFKRIRLFSVFFFVSSSIYFRNNQTYSINAKSARKSTVRFSCIFERNHATLSCLTGLQIFTSCSPSYERDKRTFSSHFRDTEQVGTCFLTFPIYSIAHYDSLRKGVFYIFFSI